MHKFILALAAAGLATTPAWAQSPNPNPDPSCHMCEGTYIPKEEIQAYMDNAYKEHRVDQQDRDIDIGKVNIALGVEHRGKLDKPGAHAGTFTDLLTEYRKANSFEGVDTNGVALIKTHAPFLLPGESRAEPQPLSFALARDTFEYEYARRAAASLKNGGEILRVEAPAIQRPAPAAGTGANP